MRWKARGVFVVAGLVALFAMASAGPARPAAAASASGIDPTDFTSTVNNPFFPLPVGTTMTYQGTRDGQPALEHITYSASTTVVDGVTVRVVEDRLFLSGVLFERTSDFFAQEKETGTVWYFGEDTATLDARGKVVSTDGSFRAGVDGAQAGIVMPGRLAIGQSFQQERATVAEDHFVVLNMISSATVPFGSFSNTLFVAEWTPLEPDVVSVKNYVKGLGLVREADVAGSDEMLELISVSR